jgi:hypothetical protein
LFDSSKLHNYIEEKRLVIYIIWYSILPYQKWYILIVWHKPCIKSWKSILHNWIEMQEFYHMTWFSRLVQVYGIQHNLLSIEIDGCLRPITYQAASDRHGLEVMQSNSISGNVIRAHIHQCILGSNKRLKGSYATNCTKKKGIRLCSHQLSFSCLKVQLQFTISTPFFLLNRSCYTFL